MISTELTHRWTQCSCKGVRSCLICEKKLKEGHAVDIQLGKNPSITSVDFLYDIATSEAVYKKKNSDSQFLQFLLSGVTIVPDFLTGQEENELIRNIEGTPWKPSQSGRYKQDYGPKVNFKKKKIKMDCFNGLPDYSKSIIERMQSIPLLNDFEVVELCNLDYRPERGSSIDPHFDDAWLWGDRLVTLNLLSDTYLTLTWGGENTPEKFADVVLTTNIEPEEIRVKVPLKRRSLVILDGESRYKWKHGILRNDITDRRVCCTFRELSKEFSLGARRVEGQALLKISKQYHGSVVW